jgi:hypothetical protein
MLSISAVILPASFDIESEVLNKPVISFKVILLSICDTNIPVAPLTFQLIVSFKVSEPCKLDIVRIILSGVFGS